MGVLGFKWGFQAQEMDSWGSEIEVPRPRDVYSRAQRQVLGLKYRGHRGQKQGFQCSDMEVLGLRVEAPNFISKGCSSQSAAGMKD